MNALNDECLVSWSKWSDKYLKKYWFNVRYHEHFIIIHENSDKYFENKCLYHVRWFYILCMMSYSDDWNNDWNALNDECLVSWSTCW